MSPNKNRWFREIGTVSVLPMAASPAPYLEEVVNSYLWKESRHGGREGSKERKRNCKLDKEEMRRDSLMNNEKR